MASHKIRRGLNLPITGEPDRTVESARQVSRVAVMAADYVGMKPTMHVQVGDSVDRGQLLFEDKKTPGVRYTAFGEGKVVAVNRGERRALQSVVIELSSAEQGGRGAEARFRSFGGQHPSSMSRDDVRELLVESGQWTALRQRPFSRVPPPESAPHSIFVTAVDSSPLAADPTIAIADRQSDFERGLSALGKLTDGTVHVCAAPGADIPLPSAGDFQLQQFAGPHPAGTAGIHIHLVAPVSRQRTAWWIGYQEVLAIGKLFATGGLDVERLVSLAGPAVNRPRVLKTRLGAHLDEVVQGELMEGENRVVSGSPLYGRSAMGEVLGYLGRHHNQITVLAEDRERELLGWLSPGFGKHSVTRAFLSTLAPGRKFALSTSNNGSDRAIVPMASYDKVFAFDIPATAMLRALAAGDLETAEELGALELDEEDLALCSYVCAGKHDYGAYLRDILTTIEKEG